MPSDRRRYRLNRRSFRQVYRAERARCVCCRSECTKHHETGQAVLRSRQRVCARQTDGSVDAILFGVNIHRHESVAFRRRQVGCREQPRLDGWRVAARLSKGRWQVCQSQYYAVARKVSGCPIRTVCSVACDVLTHYPS